MAITSSAPPMPCGKPWLPRSASVPVSSMVCTGLVRRRQPFCGPFVSKRCDEGEARARGGPAPRPRAAWRRRGSSACRGRRRRPSGPSWSTRFAAAAMAPSGSLRSRRSGNSVHVSDSGPAHTGAGKTRCLMTGINRRRYRGAVNLASLDLNLLVSLDALLQERSVTRAAARMGLSQPALSASLARLRRHFGDELLTRVGNEYRLTPLAVQLRELRPAGADRRGAGLRRPAGVRPGVLDPGVLPAGQRLRRRRPRRHASPRCSPRRRRTRGCGCTANTPAAVDRADQILLSTDLLVLPHGFVTDLSHRDLYRDEWVCVVSADNAGGRGRADRRAPARRCPGWSPSTGRRRPRPPPGRCACAASSRTSRSSPRTS